MKIGAFEPKAKRLCGMKRGPLLPLVACIVLRLVSSSSGYESIEWDVEKFALCCSSGKHNDQAQGYSSSYGAYLYLMC